MKFNHPHYTENDLVELYKCYGTVKKVSDVTGISVGCVFNHLKPYNVMQDAHSSLKGKHISEEHKQKISVANKGRIVSEESRRKMSESHKIKGIGHKKKRIDGYISVYFPSHPLATKDGYVPEHHLVIENQIGRYLEKNEVVHHKNRIRNDNRIENLELMTFSEHARLHCIERNIKRRKLKNG